MTGEKPRALVLRTAGTNCDAEMARSFELAGASVALAHLDRLIHEPGLLEEFDIVGFPGGFSYGDDVASGRVLAVKLRERLWPALRRAAERGVPMIGVCNGFQAMAQCGLLPGPAAPSDGSIVWPDRPPEQTVALAENGGARFVDDWVRVEAEAESVCVWTRDLVDAGVAPGLREEILQLPLASGEGRFVTDQADVERLRARKQIALRYVDNVNGSVDRIAGICDASGLIFGLMPHPDRYSAWRLHPAWTRLPASARQGDPPGLRIFRNGVEHVLASPAKDMSGDASSLS